ncbi:MAG: alginate export family protein [Nitrospiraceae bacterium]|nr:alginate export family protein [Nitrospiraceae bacterium]
MRKTQSVIVLVLGLTLLLGALPSAAELQNIKIGGELRIRGTWWHNSFNTRATPWLVGPQLRIPSVLMQRRPIGDAYGGQNAMSFWRWNERGADYTLVEQRTVLNVHARFTEQVAAFIELESFDVWGEDFRSNYITGVDARANSNDDVEVYQAYIEASEMFGQPLRLRVGRQELVLGSGWLVGNSSAHPEFRGLSFDAIRLTYTGDSYSVDAFWSKLAETGVIDEDGDIDLYGVYASCTAIDDMTFDLYWLLVRDARAIKDTNLGLVGEWIEDWVGLDDYDVTNLHTVGIRAAGQLNAFDFEAEAAYQFGNAGQVGALFVPGVYGDDGADFGEWAANLELGYQFDIAWQPRVYLAGAYFGGEDNRDITFWQWLNPFLKSKASVSFNRLFSNKVYSSLLDEIGALSNFWTAQAGVDLAPSERFDINLNLAYFATLDEFAHPIPRPIYWRDYIIIFAHPFSFWTRETDSELGWELSLKLVYRYSDDLEFEAGVSHLFTGDGLTDGNYSDLNGLVFTGGTDNDDADYLYVQSRLQF